MRWLAKYSGRALTLQHRLQLPIGDGPTAVFVEFLKGIVALFPLLRRHVIWDHHLDGRSGATTTAGAVVRCGPSHSVQPPLPQPPHFHSPRGFVRLPSPSSGTPPAKEVHANWHAHIRYY